MELLEEGASMLPETDRFPQRIVIGRYIA